MSVQLAMMGAQAGLSVLQGISSASRAVAAKNAQIANLHTAEQQNATSEDLTKLGYSVRAAQYNTQAAQTDITSQEVAIQTAQQELARRRMLANLGQANAIDLVARGGVETGQDSSGAIDQRNQQLSDEDVANIRMMGESKQQQLSFRKQNLSDAAAMQNLGSTFSQVAANFKQQNLESQVATAGQQANDIGIDAMFNISSKLLGSVGSMNFGGGSKTPDIDTEIAQWSKYGT